MSVARAATKGVNMTQNNNDSHRQRTSPLGTSGMSVSRDLIMSSVDWTCQNCAYTCIGPSCPACGAGKDNATTYSKNGATLLQEDSPVFLSLKSRLKGSFLGRSKKNISSKNPLSDQSFIDDDLLDPPLMSSLDHSSKLSVRVIEEKYRESEITNVVLVDEESRRGEEIRHAETELKMTDSCKDYLREVSGRESINDVYEPQANTGGYISSDDETEPPLLVNRAGEDDGDRPIAPRTRNVSPLPPRRKVTKGSSPLPPQRKLFESSVAYSARPSISSSPSGSPMPSRRNRFWPPGSPSRESSTSSLPTPSMASPSPSPAARKRIVSTFASPRENLRPPLSPRSMRSSMPSPCRRFELVSLPQGEYAQSNIPPPPMVPSSLSPRQKYEHAVVSPRKTVGSPVPLREHVRSPVQLSSVGSPTPSQEGSFEWSVAPSTKHVGSTLPTVPCLRDNSRLLMQAPPMKSPSPSPPKRVDPAIACVRKNVKATMPPPRKMIGSQLTPSHKTLEIPLAPDPKNLDSPLGPSLKNLDPSSAHRRQTLESPMQVARKMFLQSKGKQQTLLVSPCQQEQKTSEPPSPRKSKMALRSTASQRAVDEMSESLRKIYRGPGPLKTLEPKVTVTPITKLESTPRTTTNRHQSILESSFPELPGVDDEPIRSLMPIRKGFNSSHNSAGSEWMQDFNASESSLQHSTWGHPIAVRHGNKGRVHNSSGSDCNKDFNSSEQSLQDSTWDNPLEDWDRNSMWVHNCHEIDSNRDLNSSESSLHDTSWGNPIEGRDRSTVRVHINGSDSNQDLNLSKSSFQDNQWDNPTKARDLSNVQVHNRSRSDWNQALEVSESSLQDTVCSDSKEVTDERRIQLHHQEPQWSRDKSHRSFKRSMLASPPSPPQQSNILHRDEENPEDTSDPTFASDSDPPNSNSFIPTNSFVAGAEANKRGCWTCSACTFENENALHLMCAVCGTQRERDSNANLEASTSFSTPLLEEAQKEIVKARSQAIEEVWFSALQQERVDELVQLQRDLFEEYASNQTEPNQQNSRRSSTRLNNLAQLHQQESVRALEGHTAAVVTKPNRQIDRGYEDRLASLRERGRKIQEMKRQQP